MNRFNMTALGLAMSLAASAVQAGITQVSAGPAQVAITSLFGEGVSFAASGSARSDGQKWVADIVEVSPGVFALGADAGLQVMLKGYEDRPDPIVWRNFSINHDPLNPSASQRVTADRYVNGIKLDVGVSFAFMSDTIPGETVMPTLELPEGRSLLWRGNSMELGGLANAGVFAITLWDPVAFASIQVSTVPEPAIWQGMGLGLAGLMGLQVLRRRKHRGAQAVDQA